jgi:hypothetical protein
MRFIGRSDAPPAAVDVAGSLMPNRSMAALMAASASGAWTVPRSAAGVDLMRLIRQRGSSVVARLELERLDMAHKIGRRGRRVESAPMRAAEAALLRALMPIRPHVSTPMATAGAHHAVAERPDRGVVGQVAGVHDGVVVAIDRAAVDEQARDAVTAKVAHGPAQRSRL